MRFYADLHVHSKYARATSKNADLEHMAFHAARKGLKVIGTGDFTHPLWFATLKEKLIPAEPGLFRLRPEVETLPFSESVRFLLQVEISTIYKKGGGVRKIHHLIYVPDFAAAETLRARLSRIGNLTADGRPILGLDSRDLLEITLESGAESYLIPAHIWTPWFAVLGSKSGFDVLNDCYADLQPHIFALETGLSSDPPMNWRVSQLDSYRLVSNSDAHSPGNLGREATLFDTDLSYEGIRHALKTGQGYVGTLEFFPEEGKYHHDGHRQCRQSLSPEESRQYGNLCPRCGKSLTLGVLNRVQTLADKPDNAPPPQTAGTVTNLIPLVEILAEIRQTSPKSVKIGHDYASLIQTLGPELDLLERVPLEDIRGSAVPSLFREALTRLRRGQVRRQAGYDGEYGVIRLFEPDELEKARYGGFMFDAPRHAVSRREPDRPRSDAVIEPEPLEDVAQDEDQNRAIAVAAPALLIHAGPGSGKTKVLINRLAFLIQERGVKPQECLAVTFTRYAAQEIRSRLASLNQKASDIEIHTFHSLSLKILRSSENGLDPSSRVIGEREKQTILKEALKISAAKARSLASALSTLKRNPQTVADDLLVACQEALSARGVLDYDDLIRLAVSCLSKESTRYRFSQIIIDEFQDIDALQYELLRCLCRKQSTAVAVIGDPDQAIYGFRGASPEFFTRFQQDYAPTTYCHLRSNYRSTPEIVQAGRTLLAIKTPVQCREPHGKAVIEYSLPDETAEAKTIVRTIEETLGGTSSLNVKGSPYSLSDIAIFYRAETVSKPLCQALEEAGMPFRRYDHIPLTDHPFVIKLLRNFPTSLSASEVDLSSEQQRILAFLTHLYQSDPDSFHDALAVSTTADLWDPRSQTLTLMTLHAAKGLEFDVVFILGLEEGVLPWEGVEEEEEKRLFYVGMTRAKRELFLTWARKRTRRGRIKQSRRSRFLVSLEGAVSREEGRIRRRFYKQFDFFS